MKLHFLLLYYWYSYYLKLLILFYSNGLAIWYGLPDIVNIEASYESTDSQPFK